MVDRGDSFGVIFGLLIAIGLFFISSLVSSTYEQITYLTILVLALLIIFITNVLFKKFREINEFNDEQKRVNQKIEERFKIQESLDNIRLDIRELQKKVFKK